MEFFGDEICLRILPALYIVIAYLLFFRLEESEAQTILRYFESTPQSRLSL